MPQIWEALGAEISAQNPKFWNFRKIQNFFLLPPKFQLITINTAGDIGVGTL